MTPERWVRATLRDVVVHLGRGTSPTYVSDASNVFAVNQKCVRHGRATPEHAKPHAPSAPVKPDSVLRPGDLCINSTGTGTIGRVGLWEGREAGTFFADTHVTVVRPNTEQIVPRFLSESLLSPWVQREMEMSCFTGSTNQIELSKSAFSGLALLLPPLGEQKKIAAILASVDDAIDATQAVIDQLQVVKKAMMAELLTRGLPGKHARFKQTEIGEVPNTWHVLPFGEVCERMFVGIAQAATHAYVSSGGIPIIRTTNVRPNVLRSDDILRISHEFAHGMRSKALRKGDVLSARTGYPGTSVVVPEVFDGAQCFTLLVSRPGPRLLGQFMCHLMNCDIGERIVRQGQAGGAQQNLNVGVFEKALVGIPPLEEQQAICACIDSIYEREWSEHAQMAGLRGLKASLMSVLLTGEVRVTPEEEAA